MKPHFGMVIEDHKYFPKIHTLLWVWWWRHDDVIILAPTPRKIVCYRAKLPISITFEQKKIESWLTPQIVRNRMVFTGKCVPWSYFATIICWHQPNMTQIIDLGEICVWRHDDVIMTSDFRQQFRNSFSYQCLTVVQIWTPLDQF